MKKEDFKKLVEEAVIDLPEYIRNKIENVDIVIEQRPSEKQAKQ